jgi:hypothetical protein
VGDLVEVKTGLFAGDQVVTQRAPQLYAQSLKAPAKADEHMAGGESKAASGMSIAGLKIPFNLLWLAIPGVLATGGGAWWLITKNKRNHLDGEEVEVVIVENGADLANLNKPVAAVAQNHHDTPDPNIVTNNLKPPAAPKNRLSTSDNSVTSDAN